MEAFPVRSILIATAAAAFVDVVVLIIDLSVAVCGIFVVSLLFLVVSVLGLLLVVGGLGGLSSAAARGVRLLSHVCV